MLKQNGRAMLVPTINFNIYCVGTTIGCPLVRSYILLYSFFGALLYSL